MGRSRWALIVRPMLVDPVWADWITNQRSGLLLDRTL